MPGSHTGARLHQQPCSLGAKCASPGGFYRIGDEVSYTDSPVKKSRFPWWLIFRTSAPQDIASIHHHIGYISRTTNLQIIISSMKMNFWRSDPIR